MIHLHAPGSRESDVDNNVLSLLGERSDYTSKIGNPLSMSYSLPLKANLLTGIASWAYAPQYC